MIACSIRQIPDAEEGWVTQEFTVTDHGIGMSAEFQNRIYDSFTREHSSTISGIEGTGLGMGIVKKLVDMMNGYDTTKKIRRMDDEKKLIFRLLP